MKKTICLALALTLLLSACPFAVSAEEGADEVSFFVVETTPEPVPAAPTPEPTATPEPTPAPTPTPRQDATHFFVPAASVREALEGDIPKCKFPDYDTGADADWSYQSDELRIAIKKNVIEASDEQDPQVYYVADIWVRNIKNFGAAVAKDNYAGQHYTEDAEPLTRRYNAIISMTGDYEKHYTIRNGQIIPQSNKSKYSKKDWILELFYDGTMKMVKPDEKTGFDIDGALNSGVWQLWQFDLSEKLVHNSKAHPYEQFNKYGQPTTRHPRCMIGYYAPGHYCLVCVDGRSKIASGMSAYECAQLMLSLGCKEAYNLDGGTSACLTFMGETINVPSGKDNGRALVDMVIFTDGAEKGATLTYDQIRSAQTAAN